jgi:hypothetical protein
MSSNFSAKRGSLLSLKLSSTCGLRPCACQIRRTLASLNPTAAIVRVLHCVAWGGNSCVVLATTAWIFAALICTGRPGRAASFSSPAKPKARNRPRQRAALCGVMFNAAAMSLSRAPAAADNTMRERSTKRAGRLRPRTFASNCLRCSSVNVTTGAIRMDPAPPLYGRCRINTDYYF